SAWPRESVRSPPLGIFDAIGGSGAEPHLCRFEPSLDRQSNDQLLLRDGFFHARALGHDFSALDFYLITSQIGKLLDYPSQLSLCCFLLDNEPFNFDLVLPDFCFEQIHLSRQ